MEGPQGAGEGAAANLYGATEGGAEAALDAFTASPWGAKYPTIVDSWRRAWAHVIPFFAFPPEVRRVIYTTNVIDNLHMQLRKIIKTRGHFPSDDDAATQLLWLALRNVMSKSVRSTRAWKTAMTGFSVLASSLEGASCKLAGITARDSKRKS